MANLLSLAEIRKLLEEREKQISALLSRRDSLLSDLGKVEEELAMLEGSGNGRRGPRKKAGRGRKPGAHKKAGRRGRPPKAAGAVKAVKKGRRGRPPKTVEAAGAAGAAEAPVKVRKAAKKGGMTLADYAIQALEKAGHPMKTEALAAAVEKLGYKSKNTPQVLRLVAGRKGKITKTGSDEIKLA